MVGFEERLWDQGILVYIREEAPCVAYWSPETGRLGILIAPTLDGAESFWMASIEKAG